MNLLVQLLITAYSISLNLYPRKFKDEFAREMRASFRDLVLDATKSGMAPLLVVCVREFVSLPFNILQECLHEFEGKEMTMLNESNVNPPRKTATPGQVTMGALPFLLFGLLLITFELPVAWPMPEWFSALLPVLFATVLVLPAIGSGLGWVQNFPRWSYPYVGMALILAFYIQSVTTPGLNFFGIPIFGRELWGWRAWIPLIAALSVAIAFSRSLRPFISFFTNLWNDWSILSYSMAGVLPLLVLIGFDEIDRLYSLYFMAPFAVLLVGMVIFYLRARYTWQRVLVLTTGIAIIIIASAWGTTSYWLDHNGISQWGIQQTMVQARTITIIMLFPAWLQLLRQLTVRWQRA